MYIKYEELEINDIVVNKFNYYVDDRQVEEELVELLVEKLSKKMGSMFNAEGAYQMASYLLGEGILDVYELADTFSCELQDIYECDAKAECEFSDEYYEAEREYESEAREYDDWYGTKGEVLGL